MDAINGLLIFLSMVLLPASGYFVANAHNASHSNEAHHLTYVFGAMAVFTFVGGVVCVILGAGSIIIMR